MRYTRAMSSTSRGKDTASLLLIAFGALVLFGGIAMAALSAFMTPWIGGFGTLPYIVIAIGVLAIVVGVVLRSKR